MLGSTRGAGLRQEAQSDLVLSSQRAMARRSTYGSCARSARWPVGRVEARNPTKQVQHVMFGSTRGVGLRQEAQFDLRFSARSARWPVAD